ncbi:vancomycin aglycone glucosyltransferase [Actinomadura meyerae]|uniref:Vancomycin aglycone glucosyltransferase n=1 Tax=Actinomadura meyerae TaxID=240840 RepID=A0A239P6Q7_9ACTN|nr:glycosyltransferase [Actinomadura meyerae]SNT62523.1 vancomycin aglycone glucosyltransferase [Actinomadura meyerae]
MRVLLSTIGSRGEAQPVIALAVRLRGLGHDAVVCAPPDFRAWAESLGVAYAPVGPWLRGTAKAAAGTVPTPRERQRMIEGTVAEQFRAVRSAADGCDAVVGGGALAIAARSVAEALGVPYAYAAFAPVTLPSPHHAPPVLGMLGQGPADGPADAEKLWAEDEQRWNAMWRDPLNAERRRLGLEPVADVRSHLFTDRPWLAADPVLAPWPGPPGLDVQQTGAWLLDDTRPLSREVEAFLAEGEPPVYFGLGSMRAPEGIVATMLDAARAFGRRVVISSGWADLTAPADASDCLVVGEVNQQALFPRTAAVVHHGGAGTTTVAAMAGTPQLLLPQMFDQYYHAERVRHLGLGASVPPAEGLRQALGRVLDAAPTARAVAPTIKTDGTATAADRLLSLAGTAGPVP